MSGLKASETKETSPVTVRIIKKMLSMPIMKSTSMKRTMIILFCLGLVGFYFSPLFVILMVRDIITIPYLSPSVHYIANSPVTKIVWKIVYLFKALQAPLYFGVLAKLIPRRSDLVSLQHGGMLYVANFFFQGAPTNLLTSSTLLWGTESGFCGLQECWKEWVELSLLVGVVVPTIAGWKWNGGVIDGLIDYMIWGDEGKNMEKERGSLDQEERGVLM